MEGKKESKAKIQRELWGHTARLVKLHPPHAGYVQDFSHLLLLAGQPLACVCSHTCLSLPSAHELNRPLPRGTFQKKLWKLVSHKTVVCMHMMTVSLVTALGA